MKVRLREKTQLHIKSSRMNRLAGHGYLLLRLQLKMYGILNSELQYVFILILSFTFGHNVTGITPNVSSTTTIQNTIKPVDTNGPTYKLYAFPENPSPTPKSTVLQSTSCTLKPTSDKVRKDLSILLERKPKLVEIYLKMANSSLGDISSTYYKPWYWIRTTGRQGQALMMLPYYYSEMSFGMLAIGEVTLTAEIVDEPIGCLKDHNDSSQIMSMLRELVLHDFQLPPKTVISEKEYICTIRVLDNKGFGKFIPECCRHGPDKTIICRYLERGIWLKILTILLLILKIGIFLFSPLILPNAFYQPRYILDKYKLMLSKAVNIRVFVTEDRKQSPPLGVRKLTRRNIAGWLQFLSVIEDRRLVPRDTTVTMHLNEIHLRMQKKRVISSDNVPVGVLQFLYDNFVRCRIRRNPPLDVCCKANLFGKWAKDICSPFVWKNFFLLLCKAVILIALPFPYYIRLYMYSRFEADEMDTRKKAVDDLNLKLSFDGNFVAYLTPLHVLFIIIYVVFVIEGCSMSILGNKVRARFKYILRVSLREMKNVPYAQKIQLGIRILVYPLQSFGCFGLLIGVPYWIVAVPLVAAGCLFYFVPMIYLTARVLCNFYNIMRELDSRMGNKTKPSSMTHKLSENYMHDFLPGQAVAEASQTSHLRKRYFARETLTQIFILVCTVATIYATTIILVECCGFFVELIAFTLMGIIVNARVTMKFVSLIFLLVIYMYDSFNSVHVTYKDLANVIIDNGKSRAKNVDKEAAKTEDAQENTAFLINAPEDDEDPPREPRIIVGEKVASWQMHRPLLFLDTQDSLYVSKKFFDEFCNITTAGCPGPVYISLFIACIRFLAMVAFLAFVFIVVMVFSEEYSVSTSNQMLATVAGGMVPFLLRNLVFSKKISLNISSYSFKYLFDDIVRNYSKKWEIFDLDINLGAALSIESFDNLEETSSPQITANKPEVNGIDADKNEDTNKAIEHINEESELIPSPYAPEPSECDDEETIDLFIDLSINEKHVTKSKTMLPV